MTEENTPQATWTEGGSVEEMTGDDAKSEIQSIESDPSFAGDGKKDHWSRQAMLRRRDSLYRHAYPENVGKEYSGMEETLQQQGITEDTLEEMQEGFQDRDEKEVKRKTMDALTSHFGTEDEAETALGDAKGILKRFAKEDDLAFLDETGLGNDPELIGKLAEIAKIFKRGGKK